MRLAFPRPWIKKASASAPATPAGETLRALGRRLHAWAVAASRQTALYADLGVADDPQGRYEALTAFVILLLERVGPASAAGQALFDTHIADLDGAMREMGVGDLAMAKRMKGLGRNFYGRAAAWREALAVLPDRAALSALVGRTLAAGAPADRIAALVGHLLAARAALAAVDPLDPAFAVRPT